jgi:hypothetical protein
VSIIKKTNENIFIAKNHAVEGALELLETTSGVQEKWTHKGLRGNSEIDCVV